WGGAGTKVENAGMAPPSTVVGDSKEKYNGKHGQTNENPNDGHTGRNPKNVKHEPNEKTNKGPDKAREWLIWRVFSNYEVLVKDWNDWAPYALSNCARMGVMARRLADNDDSPQVTWEHAFRAYYKVRDYPVRPPTMTKAVETVRDQLCE